MKKSLIMLAMLFVVPAAHSEVVIVVARNSTVEPLSEQQVSNIFMAKSNRFPDGSKAFPMEIKGNALKGNFYKRVSSKSPSQLKSYWTTLVFTGKGKPPKSLIDKDALTDYMKKHSGAITYLLSSDVTPDMRIIHQF